MTFILFDFKIESDNCKLFCGDAPAAKNPDFNDEDWRVLELPHDWGVEFPLAESNPSGQPMDFLFGGLDGTGKIYTASGWKDKSL